MLSNDGLDKMEMQQSPPSTAYTSSDGPSDSSEEPTTQQHEEDDGAGKGETKEENEDPQNLVYCAAHLTLSTSSYSSINSDLKRSGSLSRQVIPPSDEVIARISPKSKGRPLTFEDFKEITEASIESSAQLGRAMSGTMGGFEQKQHPPLELEGTGSDDDSFIGFSDNDEDGESNDVYYDYPPGEEPSEYVPPMTPKVGGFGVETAKLEANEKRRGGAGDQTKLGSEVHEVKDGKSSLSNCDILAYPDSWGANFWCIIEQPNQQSFFANPQTGECAWAVPSGTFVLPPSMQGQWWELYDETNKLCYYFHTKTKERQWERPRGFIIPLSTIQESSMGKRFSKTELKGESMTLLSDGGDETCKATSLPPPPLKPNSEIGRSVETSKKTLSGTSRGSHWLLLPPLESERRTSRRRSRNCITTMPSSTDIKRQSRGSSKSSKKRQPLHRPHSGASEGAMRNGDWPRRRRPSFDFISLSSVETHRPFRRVRDPVKRRQITSNQGAFHSRNDYLTQHGKIGSPKFHQPLNDQQRTMASMMERKQSINFAAVVNTTSFSFEAFAAKTFSTHRFGVFRRKYPIDRLIRWQKEPLGGPLLSMESSELRKDALRMFQVILRYCGDRINPVFWPDVPSMPGLGDSKTLVGDSKALFRRTVSNQSPLSNKSISGPSVLEEVKWMLETAIRVKNLRNEVFAQIMKQMTDNNNDSSWHKAWAILSISITFFSPSKDFLPSLCGFVQQSSQTKRSLLNVNVVKMARYCLTRLGQTTGHSPNKLSITDIQAAQSAPFDPQVFGQKLEDIMYRQLQDNSISAIPKVLTFLTREMLGRNCLSTVGIFRKPGDLNLVQALKSRLNQGRYTLVGLFPLRFASDIDTRSEDEDEVCVLASTFKLWLRELKEPLIPEGLYNDFLLASSNPSNLAEVCQKLDTIHLRVLIYVVAFLQLFCSPEITVQTQMTLEAIALIFVPNIVRSEAQSLDTINTNLYYERTFVENLLRHLPCDMLDADYCPSFQDDNKATYSPDLTQADRDLGRKRSRQLGIGGNGAGLSPRSRRSSMVKS